MTAQDLDLSRCAQEPIHVPGGIQPRGWMACADEQWRLTQFSANVRDWHPGVDALLGQSLSQLLGAACEQDIRDALADLDAEKTPALVGTYEIGGRRCDCMAHRHDGTIVVELEAVAGTEARRVSSLYPLIWQFVARLQKAQTVRALCELTARELRALTGFGRVLIYRFDADGHGQVLAEDLEPDYASYQGHHFPASDIPVQARQLYTLNPFRLIADADYQASPLVPAVNPVTGRPTDLTYALLRSVSPIHLQYMRNMGTMASMSVSILVKGRLWGLISCHHHSARDVPYETRAACQHVGQILSLQIEAKEDHWDAELRLESRRLLVALLATLAETDGSLDGLASAPEELLMFGNADGAAIVLDDRCVLVGQTPSKQEVLALSDWVLDHKRDLVHTDQLARDFPPSAAYQSQASGVLALSISRVHRHLVIWFRPEVVQTVKWAGDPHKPAGMQGGILNPRTSFDTWCEELRGRSQPWLTSTVTTAEELRHALVDIVLKKAQEMAALSQELTRINKELEAFSYSVSHDLRAPLRHIAGYADMVLDLEKDALSDRGVRHLRNVTSAARFAGVLVDSLLSFSKMGRAELRRMSVDLNQLVQDLVLETMGHVGDRRIEWDVGPLPVVEADPMLLQLALRNLLSNAVKYSATRSPAVIRLRAHSTDTEHVVTIEDNGVGFDMKYVGKLFGVFQRLHSEEAYEGTGIGLANVRRIIERHGGRVEAWGRLDHGARFTITLPKPPEHLAQAAI